MGEQRHSIEDLLRKMAVVARILLLAIFVTVPYFIPDRLIPYQLDVLPMILAVVTALTIFASWAYQDRLRHYLKKILIAAAVGLAILTTIQVSLIVTVSNFGAERGTYHFLVGTHLAEEWRDVFARDGIDDNQSIVEAAHDRLPEVYGWSYYLVAATYVLGAVALMSALVTSICTIVVDQLDRRQVLAHGVADATKLDEKLVRVLLLLANPTDMDSLRLLEEARTIKNRLRESELGEKFFIDYVFAARPDDLSQELLLFKPHAVHFSGHGSRQGELILENADGESQTVSIDSIRGLFESFKNDIKCIVLNACFTSTQADALIEHIDCVVGTSQAIGDQAAIKFADGFYRGVANGDSIQDAFDRGCSKIDDEGIPEADTPQLKWRIGINPANVYVASGVAATA